MRARLRSLRDRMTRPRWIVAIAALTSPLVAIIVLLLGLALGSVRLAALLVLLYLVAVAAAGAIIVAVWRRRRRRANDGYAFDGRVDGPAAWALAAETAPAASPDTERLRLAAALRPASLPALIAFGCATRSPLARDALAARATGFRCTDESLISALTADAPLDTVRRSLGPIDLAALVALLRVVASTSDLPADAEAVRRAALLATEHPDLGGLRPEERRMLAERLLLTGEQAAAARLLAASRAPSIADWLLTLDTLGPDQEGAAPGAEQVWLTAVNALYRRAGLEPVGLRAEGATRFDRLAAEPGARIDDGPLISVIMSCHRPDAAIETAVRSIVAQTWQHWELIVVDDASGSEYDQVLERIAAMDGRIRLLRATQNAGTYVRRNEALAEARGEFATMHDSDDWAHPRRLELQARHLIGHPSLLANLSRSVRATEALEFAQPRGTMLRLTESSLLFRRVPVIERIGWFDSTRKAADTGFRLRIEAVTRATVPVVEAEAPLSFVRYVANSLSGAELGDGWMHPARMAYSSAHGRWLARHRAAGTAPRIEHPLTTRPFPAPGHLLGLPAAAHALDLLVVVDVREDPAAATDRLVDAELARWAGFGLNAGLLRSDALADRPLPHTARAAVQDLISAGAVVEVLPGDTVRADLVVALGAECLVGLGLDVLPVEAGEMLLVRHGAGAALLRTADALRGEAERNARRLVPAVEPVTVSLDAARTAVERLRA